MRLYLDTNILAFLTGLDGGESINSDVMAMIMDYENILLSSSVCYQELVHLFQIGKLRRPHESDNNKSASEALSILEDKGVTFVPVSYKHILQFSDLPMFEDHHDPNDRLIIAQAISDHIPLISSDRKFERYLKYGLEFVYNKR